MEDKLTWELKAVDFWSEIVNVLCLDLRAGEVCMAVGGGHYRFKCGCSSSLKPLGWTKDKGTFFD